jgi:hypothetical protein
MIFNSSIKSHRHAGISQNNDGNTIGSSSQKGMILNAILVALVGVL